MRIFCLITLLLSSSDFAFAISSESLPQVFTKLYPEYTLNSYETDKWIFKSVDCKLKLKIIDAKSLRNSYAYLSKNRVRNILVTRELLNELENIEELAFLLAHEMSHLDFEHYALPNFSAYVFSEEQKKKISEHLQNLELQADNMARYVVKKSGFDLEKSLSLLEKKFKNELGFFEQHPQPEFRISMR